MMATKMLLLLLLISGEAVMVEVRRSVVFYIRMLTTNSPSPRRNYDSKR